MDKILYLQKRGCDFWEDDIISELSDVGNYRVGAYNYSITGKNGIHYTLDFSHTERYHFRKTNVKTGQLLKKPVKEIINRNALSIDTCFKTKEGSYRDLKLEDQVRELNLNYTLDDILKAVNFISKDRYSKIEFIQ